MSHSIDPKSDDVYYPFLPWLGKLVLQYILNIKSCRVCMKESKETINQLYIHFHGISLSSRNIERSRRDSLILLFR